MKQTKLEAMKAVYTYFFPEVRKLMRTNLPDELFFVTTPIENINSVLKTSIKVPSTKDGNVDLDEVHIPIINRIVEIYKPIIHKLVDFKYFYPTSGSSEGIFHLLTKLKVEGIKTINVLKGEYEGYAAQAQNLGMKVNFVDETEVDRVERGYWFISNPSSRDGNIIQNEFINKLCDLGHKIILDLAYVGTTKPYKFDLSHQNIESVVMSFSKPYGVFRFRTGGFIFSRNEINTLYGNKWFKDITRLFQALMIAEKIGPTKLYKKYKKIQKQIISEINKDLNLRIKESDVFLLGYLPKKDSEKLTKKQLELISEFRRGDNYRFCLTPYFEREENYGA